MIDQPLVQKRELTIREQSILDNCQRVSAALRDGPIGAQLLIDAAEIVSEFARVYVASLGGAAAQGGVLFVVADEVPLDDRLPANGLHPVD